MAGTGVETEAIAELGSTVGRTIAAQAALAARRLLVLDDVWTAQVQTLAAAPPGTQAAELPGVALLVEDLVLAIRDLAERATRLRPLLNAASNEALDEALDAVLTASSHEAELRDIVEADLLSSELGGYSLRAAAIASCDYVAEEAAAEIELLYVQLAQLREGEGQAGDVRPPFRCAAWIVLLAGGVAVVVGGGGAPAMIVAGVGHEVGAGLFGWKESRCKEMWRTITRGRRD
jgi:hypothetical protein